MKIAILLRGAIGRNKSANSYFLYEFSYKKTLKSFQKHITNDLDKNEIKYDLYGSIKASPYLEENKDFVKDFEFIEYIFNEDTTQFDDIVTGLELIKSYNINYDLVLITRIDLLYKNFITKWNYNENKFNFCWKEALEKSWSCDNIYIFPFKYIDTIINLYKINSKHFNNKYFAQNILSKQIKKNLGTENIHYMTEKHFFSGTNWGSPACNNPIYIIYGYAYHFGNIYTDAIKIKK